MTTNRSIWRIEGPEIVEQPTMEKPNDSAEYYSVLDFRGEEKADEALRKYYAHCKALRRYPHNLPDSLQVKDLIEGIDFILDDCETCGGDGKETCNNPDHGFIDSIGGEIGRLGCPVCGHDLKHKVKNGGNCDKCNGIGKIALPISQPEQILYWKVTLWELICYWETAKEEEKRGSYSDIEKYVQSLIVTSSQPEQPISEEGTFTKWLIEGNIIFFIDDLKELVRQVNEKKLMWSKFCEILNMKVFERYHSTPSQEAIEFAEWASGNGWSYVAAYKAWRYMNRSEDLKTSAELHHLFLEHKSKQP